MLRDAWPRQSILAGSSAAIGHRIPGIFQVRPDLLTQIPSRLALLAQRPGNTP